MGDGEGSRSVGPVGGLGGTAVARSIEASLLWGHSDLDTVAGASTVCPSVRSSAGNAHTGRASLHYVHVCASPDDSVG